MKKTLLFFIVFLFFGFVNAEEVQKESELAEDKITTGSEAQQEKDEQPKIIYIQPAIGFGTGMSAFRPTLALDIDFLAAHTSKVNYYIGLDLDLRWPLIYYDLFYPIIDSSFLVNGVFDVTTVTSPHVRSVSVWISLGLEMYYGREINDSGKKDATLFYAVGWGAGVDLVFTPNIILKLGLDNFLGCYPDLTFAVGYRF